MSLRMMLPAVGLCLLLINRLHAADELPANSIHVGGSITAAIEILRRNKIEFVEGGLAITRTDADISNLLCIFDKERTRVVLGFSKSKGTITGISIIIVPAQKHSRIDEIWLEAQSVTPAENGKYAIEFLRHIPPQIRAGAKNVIP